MNGSGAISAKAKAMHGTRITADQYEELIRKKSVPEIASILKHDTSYADSLRDIHENTIHRGQLEHLLRQDLYQRMDKLIRYADGKHREYYMATLKQLEIDQIMARIRILISQDFEHAISNIPLYFKRYTKLNIDQLINVTTFEQLLDGVKGTPYEAILRPFATKVMAKFAYTDCETAMHKYYIEYVLHKIDVGFKGATRKTLRMMWMTRVELDNITKIYRYKKFFHVEDALIRASLIACEGSIPKAQLEAMISSTSAEQFLKLLAESPYHLRMDDKDYVYIEYYADMISYHLARRHMRYDNAPAIVYTAYQLLAEREIENLINIIEGVRYLVPPDEIRTMLIYEKE